MVWFFWRIINKADKILRQTAMNVRAKKADIVVMATSAQNNLGDHAISVALRRFLKIYCPGKRVAEIPKELFYGGREKWRRKIRKDAVIIITGGGFLGDLWMTEETLVRDILSDYRNHKVVIFPQTIYFAEDSVEYRETFDHYRAVPKLTINAREKRSYDILKNELGEAAAIFCMPDMVLSLDYNRRFHRKKTALICIRADKETCLCEDEKRKIFDLVQKKAEVSEITTIKSHIVPIAFRKREVFKMLDKMAHSGFVVTDRLHAMIFAAVTATPCIALDNVSHKVSGVYEWIKHLKYVQVISDLGQLDDAIEKALEQTDSAYDRTALEPLFAQLAKEI